MQVHEHINSICFKWRTHLIEKWQCNQQS